METADTNLLNGVSSGETYVNNIFDDEEMMIIYADSTIDNNHIIKDDTLSRTYII